MLIVNIAYDVNSQLQDNWAPFIDGDIKIVFFLSDDVIYERNLEKFGFWFENTAHVPNFDYRCVEA